ncbi:FCGBP protein, partial [Pelecanoides urinatrix]|nr:FCGBP protein [Pelecanoides urinatrix]
LETDFGLRVTYDWNWHLLIDLPSSYYKHTCGLCGNFNLKPEDDVPESGSDLAAVVAWAKGWKAPDDDDPFCWDYCEGTCPVCEEEKKELYGGNQYCGLIKKSFQGPFKACHDVVKPRDFYRNCLYDVCMSDGAKKILCQALEAYASTCKKHGAIVHDWRTPSGCRPVCPPNQHYELCGPACPATCRGQAEAEECEEAAFCTEGCFCDEGFLLSGDRCVPLAQCGCLHEGRYYKMGEEFFTCPRCSERCTCKEAGVVECRPEGCAAGEGCTVQNGVRGCYPHECGRCQVLGAVSYSTFDGHPLHFAGTCTYTLAAVEATGPEDTLVPFTVEVEKESGEEGPLIRQLLVTVHGVTVGMARGTQWEVDGERHLLPLSLAGGAVTASQEGTHRVLRAQGGLKLLYDGSAYALLTLPASHRRRTRGLCGNFDGDAGNDLAAPQELGDAWGTLTTTCTHGSPPPPCPAAPPGPCEVLAEATGPFAGCHGVVAPQEHVAGCRREQCGRPGAGALCRSLQGYAAACQAAGGRLREWRAAAECPLSCPPNSHYELCTSTCDRTCAGLLASTQCTDKCFEGCQCDEGFLFNGDECVPMDSCGC